MTDKPAELLAVESEMLQTYVEEVGNYSQRFASAALQSQVAMVDQGSRLLDGAGGTTDAQPPVRTEPRAVAAASRRRTQSQELIDAPGLPAPANPNSNRSNRLAMSQGAPGAAGLQAGRLVRFVSTTSR